MSFEAVCVKQEPEWSAEGEEMEGYDGRELTDKLDNGPDVLLPLGTTFAAHVEMTSGVMEVSIQLESQDHVNVKRESCEIILEPADTEIVEHGFTKQPGSDEKMTMNRCCVPFCGKTKLDGTAFQRFPNPRNFMQVERFRAWLLAIGGDLRATDNEHIFRNRRVCREHFEERFYCAKNRLMPTAVPTLHLTACNITSDKEVEIKLEKCFGTDEKHAIKTCEKTSDDVSTITGRMDFRTEKQAASERIQKTEKPFRCKICNKTFSWRTHLNDHHRTHTGEKPYSCNICHKQYAVKSNLTIHLRIHTGEKPFSCQICNKRFRQKTTLDEHVRTHTGEKPLSCKICHKRFSHSTTLYLHERVHTGEKPYSCNFCEKRFARRTGLNYHKLTHTGEKPFSCKVCGKCFSRTTNLHQHEKIHKREKRFCCTICDMRFAWKCHLSDHERIHEEEQVYIKEICDVELKEKSVLNSNMRESGEVSQEAARKATLVTYGRRRAGGEFSCDVCKKQFTRQSNLTQHVQLLHAG